MNSKNGKVPIQQGKNLAQFYRDTSSIRCQNVVRKFGMQKKVTSARAFMIGERILQSVIPPPQENYVHTGTCTPGGIFGGKEKTS